ncbi:MAG: hypothetical protein ACQKBY_09825 [Verrucomicrobiales bacterium]
MMDALIIQEGNSLHLRCSGDGCETLLEWKAPQTVTLDEAEGWIVEDANEAGWWGDKCPECGGDERRENEAALRADDYNKTQRELA